jgi:hypothetical protein
VKDIAKDSKDSKLSDPFYDSLEGLLSDLKAVTVVCCVEPLPLLVVSILKLGFEYRIIGMLRHFSNPYPRRKYRTTTKVICFSINQALCVAQIRHSYFEPNGLSDNAEEGQAEDIQVETRIQR